MTFRNPLTDAAGYLLKTFVRSANYVAGQVGWTINEDGTAEFSNINVRGVLGLNSGPAGDLQDQIYWTPDRAKGASIRRVANQQLLIRGARPADTVTYPGCYVALHDDGPDGDGYLVLSGQPVLIARDYQIGSGPIGRYYLERFTNPGGQNTTNGTLTTLANWDNASFARALSINDYATSPMNVGNGQWTCPADGQYTFRFYAEWAGGSALAGVNCVYNIYNVTQNKYISWESFQPATSTGLHVVTVADFIKKNDVVTFRMSQSSGATKQTASTCELTIHRDI